jgi:hypothetical protein
MIDWFPINNCRCTRSMGWMEWVHDEIDMATGSNTIESPSIEDPISFLGKL